MGQSCSLQVTEICHALAVCAACLHDFMKPEYRTELKIQWLVRLDNEGFYSQIPRRPATIHVVVNIPFFLSPLN